MFRIYIFFLILTLSSVPLNSQNVIVVKNKTSCKYTILIFNELNLISFYDSLEPGYKLKIEFLDGYNYHYMWMETELDCIPECINGKHDNVYLQEPGIKRIEGINGDVIQKLMIYNGTIYNLEPPNCIRF